MRNRVLWLIGLVLASGCAYGVREQTDQMVCDLAARVRDVEPPSAKDQTPAPMPPADSEKPRQSQREREDDDIQAVSLQQPDKPIVPKANPLVLPLDLPGASAEPIKPPPLNASKEEKEKYIKKLFPPLPPLPPDYRPAPGPDGHPLTLADLQRLATAYSPTIKQAAAAVKAAEGAAIQAGAYPNPSAGYEADTVGNGATAGFQGIFVDQVIKTGSKLKLQQAASTIDLLNAEMALRRAQADLAGQVRTNYFAVLVALENIRVSKALVQLTDRIYRTQVDLLAPGVGITAHYEPMQLRPLALQARFNLIQAQNQYRASWKQLAATLGLPGMPPTEITGRVDMPMPHYDYEEVLARVLSGHTDVLIADNNIAKARYLLRLAQITPYPDMDLRIVVQKDFTTPPFQVVHSVQLGGSLPIWDNNRGNIIQAEGMFHQALDGPHLARDQLTSSLADAFNRYDTNRRQVAITKQQLDDQVRVYRGLYERFHFGLAGDVKFGDLVTAEQTLAGFVSAYITALGLQWTAAVDVSTLLQTDDFFQATKREEVAPVPDLDNLAPLPCEHPCVPIRDTKWKDGADGQWPPPESESKTKPMPPANNQQKGGLLPSPDAVPATARPVPLRQTLPAAQRSTVERGIPMESPEPPPEVHAK